MIKNKWEFEIIKSLIGQDVTAENLRCVDMYISKNVGIFIPSIGFCEYAIKPNHTHPSYSFVILFDKKTNFIKNIIDIPENKYLLTCISPHIPHEETPSDTFTRYIAIFINKDFFNSCLSKYPGIKCPDFLWNQFAIDSIILTYLNKFMTEYEENFICKNEMLNNLSYLITNEIIRCIFNIKSQHEICSNTEINKICSYMEQHFSEKITVESLSSLCNMSQSSFNRLFKKEMSISPIEYLIKLRLNKSKKYLRETNYSITDISLKCGFYSASHFSSYFLKQFGLSPSEYHKIFTTN